MSGFPENIWKEDKIDMDTLKNLGPLRNLAGSWKGTRGLDRKPKEGGPKEQEFIEVMEMQAIDPQNNGPQVLYGLRYHTHITKPNQVKTYHEQVGYWLWEPKTKMVTHTLTIPRGMVLMASGKVEEDAKEFVLKADWNDDNYGIRSSPFLDYSFKTLSFEIKVKIHGENCWEYIEDTILKIKDREELFHHVDKSVLERVSVAKPNPVMRNE